jgi:hypothetical protein
MGPAKAITTDDQSQLRPQGSQVKQHRLWWFTTPNSIHCCLPWSATAQNTHLEQHTCACNSSLKAWQMLHCHPHTRHKFLIHKWSHPRRLQKTSLCTVYRTCMSVHIHKNFCLMYCQIKWTWQPNKTMSILWQLGSFSGVDKHSGAVTFQRGCTQSKTKNVRVEVFVV